MSLPCTFEEFKRRAKEFHEAAPTCNADELHGAWSCLASSYLGMTEEQWINSAAAVIKMEVDLYLECNQKLLNKS